MPRRNLAGVLRNLAEVFTSSVIQVTRLFGESLLGDARAALLPGSPEESRFILSLFSRKESRFLLIPCNPLVYCKKLKLLLEKTLPNWKFQWQSLAMSNSHPVTLEEVNTSRFPPRNSTRAIAL